MHLLVSVGHWERRQIPTAKNQWCGEDMLLVNIVDTLETIHQ